jgi:hypothetical protein
MDGVDGSGVQIQPSAPDDSDAGASVADLEDTIALGGLKFMMMIMQSAQSDLNSAITEGDD